MLAKVYAARTSRHRAQAIDTETRRCREEQRTFLRLVSVELKEAR